MKDEMQPGEAYVWLVAMALVSYCAMFVLMYAMVDTFANVYFNFNQAYMAGLMTAPMVIIEILLMRSMYPSKVVNYAILGASILVLGLFWAGIREQAGISDKQFLASMIPHHAGAILMCKEAPITDAEVKKLCHSIITSQQLEIDQMKRILSRLHSQ